MNALVVSLIVSAIVAGCVMQIGDRLAVSRFKKRQLEIDQFQAEHDAEIKVFHAQFDALAVSRISGDLTPEEYSDKRFNTLVAHLERIETIHRKYPLIQLRGSL